MSPSKLFYKLESPPLPPLYMFCFSFVSLSHSPLSPRKKSFLLPQNTPPSPFWDVLPLSSCLQSIWKDFLVVGFVIGVYVNVLFTTYPLSSSIVVLRTLYLLVFYLHFGGRIGEGIFLWGFVVCSNIYLIPFSTYPPNYIVNIWFPFFFSQCSKTTFWFFCTDLSHTPLLHTLLFLFTLFFSTLDNAPFGYTNYKGGYLFLLKSGDKNWWRVGWWWVFSTTFWGAGTCVCIGWYY